MGLLIRHNLEGLPFEVFTEYDVTIKQNLLDFYVIRRKKVSSLSSLADGLNDLRKYNLISYKSFRESFNIEALEELVCYSILFRKDKARKDELLLPEKYVRVVALSTMKPVQILSEKKIKHKDLGGGAYNLQFGTVAVRLIVIQELPQTKAENGNFLLFSADEKQVKYGIGHNTLDGTTYNSLLLELLRRYKTEEGSMAELMKKLSKEEMFVGLLDLLDDKKQVLDRFAPEDRLESLSPKQLAQAIHSDKVRELFGDLPDNAKEALRALPARGLFGFSPKATETVKATSRER